MSGPALVLLVLAFAPPIMAVDLTTDGKLIAIGRGPSVHVVDVASGRELAILVGQGETIQSIRFTPDGKRLAVGGLKLVTVWDVPAQRSTPWTSYRTFGPHVGRVLAIDFRQGGQWMATGSGEASRSGEVQIWNVTAGTLVLRLDTLHADTVFGLRFSPDGLKLATASADRHLKVSGSADGKELKSFEGHAGHVLAVDWSGDGKKLVSGGAEGVLKVWDYESGELLRTLPPAPKEITAVRWLAGKPIVAGASGDGTVRFWNSEGEGSINRTFTGPHGYLFCLASSPDGKLVAAGGVEGLLYLWNGDDGHLIRKFEPKN